MVFDMGDKDEVHIILERPFLNTTSAIIYKKIWRNPLPISRRIKRLSMRKKLFPEKEEEEKFKKSESHEASPQSKKVWKRKETSSSSSSPMFEE
jgi:hypothetical protein